MNKEEIRTIVEWAVSVTTKAVYDRPDGVELDDFSLEIPLDDGEWHVGKIECTENGIELIAEEDDGVNEIAWQSLKEKFEERYISRTNLYEEES